MSDPDRYRLARWEATYPHHGVDHPLFLSMHRVKYFVAAHQAKHTPVSYTHLTLPTI